MSAPLDADAVRKLAPSELYSLEGRTAIVTGATGGLGQWFAAGLGAAGASVLVTDLEQGPVDELVAVLTDAGVRAAGVAVDLADEDAPERLVAAAVERLGGVHVLVNNAVVNRRMPILEMDRDTWDWITRINLRLPYFLSQAAARRMIEQGEGGSIVSISSLNVLYALEQISVYGPTKAGLSQLTKVMALEWAEHGIRANAIAPGFMDTPLAAPDLGGRRHAPLDPEPRSDRAAGASTGARRRLPPARLRRRLVPQRADAARRRRRECRRALVSP